MDQLIQQLLFITQLESQNTLKTKKQDIIPTSQEIITMIQQQYQDKKLQRKINIPKQLTLACHLSSRNMILQNLLDNAAKYSPLHGKITIDIQENKMTIQNEGEGINPKHIQKIRERFRQEDSSRTDTKSLGLGLYLVQKLVHLQQRDISVQSQKNKETTFTLSFFTKNI